MRPIWESSRLIAREMTLADLAFVAAMLADPEVMRFYPRCYTRDEASAWIDRQRVSYRSVGHGRWLIEERAGGQPVGQVGLIRATVEGVEETEVAYMIDASRWRRGYAAEAASASRDFAFGALGLTRVVSLVRPENIASRAVANRIGMRPGRLVLHAGLEHILYELERDRREDAEPGSRPVNRAASEAPVG